MPLEPAAVAFLVAFAGALGTAVAVIVRRLARRGARAAGVKVREVVSDAVENTAAVKELTANTRTMRNQLDSLAWRVLTLENRRPGGRRRNDPPVTPPHPGA